ncbi:MAG TPA: hypothetical protein VLB46_12355 [Pyrinomonadaceae bacterium]|nr:hypothetical protein [Pyrinomonadaceae bacterium]
MKRRIDKHPTRDKNPSPLKQWRATCEQSLAFVVFGHKIFCRKKAHKAQNGNSSFVPFVPFCG